MPEVISTPLNQLRDQASRCAQ